MNYTDNYSLGLPLASEKYDVSIVNANNTTIDEQLKANADAIDEIEANIPSIATTSEAGIVMPDGSTITITSDGIISATQPTVDSALSTTSTNAVQNNVITDALSEKADVATTLEGYGIIDAYTIDETNDAITAAIEELDVDDTAVDGSYVSAVSETDGKITVTRIVADTVPTASSTTLITSGGVYTALESLNYEDTAVSGSYVTSVSEENGVIYVTREAADTAPTDNSTKMVTSGGVYTAIEDAIDSLDASDTAVDGSYVTAVNETNGIVGVTRESADTTPTSSSTKMVTSGGVYTAIEDAVNALDASDSAVSGSYVTAVSETNGVISVTREAADTVPTSDSTKMITSGGVKSAIDTAISSTYKAGGQIAFADLPSLTSDYLGYVYDISDSFTTTSDFVEGAGKEYPANTNVAIVDVDGTYYYDVLAGFVDLSGYYTSTETDSAIETAISTKQDIIEVDTMPTASSDYLGKVLIYVGSTTSSYTQGQSYLCVYDSDSSTYSWEPTATKVVVDDVTIQENNDGELETVLKSFVGTADEWEAVTDKSYYDLVNITDDNEVTEIDAVPTEDSGNLVASGGVYSALSQKADKSDVVPVYDATLTINKNGTSVGTFTANAYSDVSIDISVPTTTSELTNDSGYITSSDMSDYYTSSETDSAISTAVNALDVSDTVVSGSYVTGVSETNGVISVTRESADTTPTSSSTKMITSGGVYSALSEKADASTTISGYGITDAYTKTEVDSLIGGVSVSVDDVTIQENSDGELETVIKTFIGTESEWDSVTDKSYYDLVNITDDSDVAEVDTTPTEDSTNLVTSGGVYSAIQYAIPTVTTTDPGEGSTLASGTMLIVV